MQQTKAREKLNEGCSRRAGKQKNKDRGGTVQLFSPCMYPISTRFGVFFGVPQHDLLALGAYIHTFTYSTAVSIQTQRDTVL